MVALPRGVAFGSGRRKQVRREMRSKLRSGLGLPIEEPRVGDLAKFQCVYPSRYTQASEPPAVVIDLVTRVLDQNWIALRPVQSIAGSVADPPLLEQHPFLAGFSVLAVHPMVTLVEKLSALHTRSVSDRPANTMRRARDIYDIPFLLRCDQIAPLINRDLVAELHAEVLAAQPVATRHSDAERPRLGFASSPAFTPGHPACEALRSAYSSVLEMVFDDDALLSFENALSIIEDHAEVL